MSSNPLLKLTDPMMKGPAVKRLQEDLHGRGYNVKADGWFGPGTDKVVKKFQADEGLQADGIVGNQTWSALEKVEEEPEKSPRFLDRTTMHPKPSLYARPRSWAKDIWGVTLHQTGIQLNNKPSRWDTLGAHIGVLSDGTVILVNPLTDMIWHAQKLSHKTIGVEINGNHEGIFGDPKTLWKGGGGPHPLTKLQIEACNDLLYYWLLGQFRAHDVKWENIHAHRQASADRRGDPGSEIWQKIGMVWQQRLEALHLGRRGDGGPDFVTGSGLPIPKDWNPTYTGNRY